MRLGVVIFGLVFLSLGVTTYAYAVTANLQEYACSDPCTLVITGNSTHSICRNNCPYIGVPGSDVKIGGLLLAILGSILIGVGFLPKRNNPYITL
ncbi:MAG TPA: hypothetical protein VN739_09860 [Nitrososphaerales archaeon]|nr:hypothetical protein [Nitrososphaerales archaeon]